MPVVISQHLLNVFVQLANKRGLKKMFTLDLSPLLAETADARSSNSMYIRKMAVAIAHYICSASYSNAITELSVTSMCVHRPRSCVARRSRLCYVITRWQLYRSINNKKLLPFFF
jgi:hypothetical protein